MTQTPSPRRAVAFIDGQNLFHAAKRAFGYRHPNYDVVALANAVAQKQGWDLQQIRFYTGVPSAEDSPVWNHFWAAKLGAMGHRGVQVFSRLLRYRNKTIHLPNGFEHSFLTGDEKGIDIRIALDLVRLAHRQEYDVALLFSQDQDFSEAAEELRLIGQEQRRRIDIVSAFPVSPTTRNRRGVQRTDWLPIDRGTYDRCLDKRDYRRKRSLAA